MVGLSIKDPIREQQMFGSRAVILFLGVVLFLGMRCPPPFWDECAEYWIVGVRTGFLRVCVLRRNA